MKTKALIIKKEKELEILRDKLKQEEQEKFELEYETISFKNKEFRIYKWEDKPFNKFIFPKEFRLAEFQEVVELLDNKLIDYPKDSYYEVYFCKHYSKIKQKENNISRLYLCRDSDMFSDSRSLASSNDDGRVVCVRNLK